MIFSIFKFLPKLYYGWRMVGVVSAIRVLGGGLHGYGFTIFFLPISNELGLNRAQTSLAFSLARAEGAIEGPIIGYLIDRFGPKPIIVSATALTGIGYILLSWVNGYLSFLAIYLGVVSLAFTAGFVQTPMVVANNWFIRQRARAMTVVAAAVPVGGALVAPLLAAIVHAWGWRWGAFLAGCAFLSVCIPLGSLVKRSPESIGLLPDGDPPQETGRMGNRRHKPASTHPIMPDVTVADAMKTFAFWAVTLSIFARVATHSTLIVHFVPLLVWKGVTQEVAALVLGTYAFLNLLAHFVLGWIADKMNKPGLLSLWMVFPIASMLTLLWGQTIGSVWVFAILFCTLDAAFPVSWAIIGDFFGRKHFATIRGTMTFFYMWGGALGPVTAGYFYDITASYTSVLWGVIVMLSMSGVLTGLLIKPWRSKTLSVRGAPA